MAGFQVRTVGGSRGDRQRLILFLVWRVLVISLFLGGTIVYQFRSPLGPTPPVVAYLYLLVGFSYLHAVLSGFLLLRMPGRAVTQFMVSWDLLLATALIYLSGGVESLFSFLYLLVIVTVSVLLPRRDVLFVACASAILYGSLLDLQYFGFLPKLPGLEFPARLDGREIFYAVFVNVTGFLLAALLSGTLSERLRRSQQALEQREVDLEELESLNRTILANINTGLMIVNPAGRLRLFNQAAERMTGYGLKEVYNRDIRKVFPDLGVVDDQGLREVQRGQAPFVCPDGSRKIFGFASSLVREGRESDTGLLVVFQDLTQVLAMEEQLKRADRLAAVGRLAAGMAHEIRNPLASISGSIQLLLEGEHVAPEDRQLMSIVVREADRLSLLLTDFLLYARPQKPQTELFDPAEILEDLQQMLGGDQRFSSVSLECRKQPHTQVRADRMQLRQALWDLLVNAVEAVPEGGVVRFGVTGEAGELFVEDNGPGIAPALVDQIFEPFFTTKEHGTGLGLATVHAIVDANEGQIYLSQGPEGGARFVLQFPQED